MKKIKVILILIALLIALSPSMVMAKGLVPAGVTLQGWSTTANNGGKSSTINLKYTNGFSDSIPLDAPFSSSWYPLNDVRPILQAYKEGWGPDLGGEGGNLGTTINFAPNVLAAMKAQNFNPAQVGGANIPPESTILNEEQTAWLKQIGYTVPAVTTTPSTPSPVVKSNPPPVQAQPETKQETLPSQPVTTKPVTTPLKETDSAAPKADPADPVGQTVKTPATPMTQEMIAESQILAAENPPTINEPKVSVIEQANESEQPATHNNIWLGVALVVIVAAVAIAVILVKRKSKSD